MGIKYWDYKQVHGMVTLYVWKWKLIFDWYHLCGLMHDKNLIRSRGSWASSEIIDFKCMYNCIFIFTDDQSETGGLKYNTWVLIDFH